MRAELLTQNDKSLLGRVRLVLLLRVAVIVDNVTCVTNESTKREVCESPCPSEGSSNLARLGLRLGGLVSIGSSEGDAARVVEFHGDRRSSRGLGGSRKGASRNATAGGHLANPGEGRHGSRGGSHWEDLLGRSSIESDWREKEGKEEEKKEERKNRGHRLRVSGPDEGVASGWGW
jgi:hypothetical protein